MSPREKADRARQIMEDPVFKEALRDIRERIVGRLEAVGVTDKETEHELVISLQLLQRIPARFQVYADELVMERSKEEQERFMQSIKKQGSQGLTHRQRQ